MTTDPITLAPAPAGDLPAFKKNLQAAFSIAVVEAFGPRPNGPIPSDQDLDESFAAPGAVVLHILCGSDRVGGAVLTIDKATQRNSLDLFFLLPDRHGQGLGLRAWRAIERAYPRTRVWVCHTRVRG